MRDFFFFFFFCKRHRNTWFPNSWGLALSKQSVLPNREAICTNYQLQWEPLVPQFILRLATRGIWKGQKRWGDGLVWFGWSLVWFIFTVQLLLYGPPIFLVHDNLLLCFVTLWIRLLHFDITCLLEMSAFVVILAQFVTAVWKRTLWNKSTATGT